MNSTFRAPNTGQISAAHDSREVQMLRNKGVIHVIKDEAQILPYCILHLTGGLCEKAPGLNGATGPNGPTTFYGLTGPKVPARPNNGPTGVTAPTNSSTSSAAPTMDGLLPPLCDVSAKIWQIMNSQSEESGQGLLQHQHQ